jgi:hypothetical protein
MYKILTTFLSILFILASEATAIEQTPNNQNAEPPIEYFLEINGKNYPIEIDKMLVPPVELKNPQIMLKAKPNRLFKAGGVTFQYPRQYNYKTNFQDPNVAKWTISGPKSKIIYQYYKVKIDHASLVEYMVGQFGKENCKIKDSSISIGGKSKQGTLMTFKIADILISQEMFSFESPNGLKVIALQNTLTDAGQIPQEGIELKELVSKSFSIN